MVLYRPNSEFARAVEDFVYDYRRGHGNEALELVDVDSRDGAATASLYDIMEHPAVMVLRDDGSVLNSWQGPMLPLQADVAAYAYA